MGAHISIIKSPSEKEFIALMAVMMSFVALSIDAMLPALAEIGRELKVSHPNENQRIISTIFFGMGVGLMLFGPLSDSYGRKPTAVFGTTFFILGGLICYFSHSLLAMLLGRFFQGFGAAAARVVTLAMIRDKYVGAHMAKIVSLIMIVFIMIPVLAPTVGQIILYFGDWRDIFAFITLIGTFGLIWFILRQNETLTLQKRTPFSIRIIINAIGETLKNTIARSYMTASGLIFGAFIGYITCSQQVLQELYQLENQFPLYFGALALCIGLASYFNARWVERIGMVPLCLIALKTMTLTSILFMGLALMFVGQPPLATLMCYLAITLFCFGLLFSNFNALAIQPLGHIAGTANSVISSFQTLMSVLLGGGIGYLYNETVIPLVAGFLMMSSLSLIITSVMKDYKNTNYVG